MWIAEEYLYRRQLSVNYVPEDLPQYHPVEVVLPLQLYSNGKLREDHEDLEIIFVDSEGNNNPLYREVVRTNTEITVTFTAPEAVAADTVVSDFYVYYGNPDLVNQVTRDATAFSEWPVSYAYDDSRITYTKPGTHWEEGESRVEGARANFIGYAKDARIVFGGLSGHGIAETQLDLEDVEDVDLNIDYSSEPSDIMKTYNDLDVNNRRELRIRVSGRSNSASQDSTIKINSVDVVRPASVEVLGEELNQAVWSSSVGGA